jgi:DNA-binding PadR family transcriptional regulator
VGECSRRETIRRGGPDAEPGCLVSGVPRRPAPELSLTDWLVLGVLCEQPQHGFAVARELAVDGELGSIWTVRRPLVYRSLDHLVDEGLVEPRAVEPGVQGPYRTVMAPTRSGRARVARWLTEPVAHPRDVRTVLLAKLAMLTRRGEPLTPLVRAQLDDFTGVLGGLERKRRTSDGVADLTVQGRVSANRAIGAFLEGIIRDEQRRR